MDDNIKKDQPINSDSRQGGSPNSGNKNRRRRRNNYNRNRNASNNGRQNTADKRENVQNNSRNTENRPSAERTEEQRSSDRKPQNDRQRSQNNRNRDRQRSQNQQQRDPERSQNLRETQQKPKRSQKPQEKRQTERSQETRETKQKPERSQKPQETQQKPERSQKPQETQQKPERSQKPQETRTKPERSQETRETKQKPERSQKPQETRTKPERSQESRETKQKPERSQKSQKLQRKPERSEKITDTKTTAKAVNDTAEENVREITRTVENAPSPSPKAEKKTARAVRTEQTRSLKKTQSGEKNTPKQDNQKVRRKSAQKEAENVKPEKTDSDEKLNRRKSDCRFWARLASVAAIIPVYLVLLVFASFLPRSTVSNIEKRNLATFPEFTWSDYWSGKYTSDITHYFDDTVPFRDTLKQAASRFSGLFGIQYNDVQVSGSMEAVNKTKPVEAKSNKAVSSDAASDSEAGLANQVKGEEIADGVYVNGVIVVYQHDHYRAMTMYGGGYGETYAQAVNKISDALPRTKVYSLVAPTSSEFYTPENFSDYNASQEEDIIEINNMLHNATGINVCPTLLSHKQEDIYTRTDHHWTALGAYYAAKDFAKAAGVAFPKLSEYNEVVKPGYVGTLYSFSGNNANLLNDPEDFVYYVPKDKKYKAEYYDYAYNYVFDGDIYADVETSTEYYSTFIYGDAYSIKIDTGVKNGRRCLVVKESYGDALVPFLTGSFEEVYVVDMRYFERNLIDFANEMNITDLLVCCCSYSAVGPNADSLDAIRTGGIPMTPTVENEEITGSDAALTQNEGNIENDEAGSTVSQAAETVSENEAQDGLFADTSSEAQDDLFAAASSETEGNLFGEDQENDPFGFGQDDDPDDEFPELGLYTEE